MKNITSRGFAAMAAAMAMAAASIDAFGSAMRQRTLFGHQGHQGSSKMATAKPKRNHAGNKLMKKAENGTVGAGMHGTNLHGPVKGVTISPKKDIGKGPAVTLSVRNKQILQGQKRVINRGHYADRMNKLIRDGAVRYI